MTWRVYSFATLNLARTFVALGQNSTYASQPVDETGFRGLRISVQQLGETRDEGRYLHTRKRQLRAADRSADSPKKLPDSC